MKIEEFVKQDYKKICGIYAIICNKTWRSYVGQSVDIFARANQHNKLLNNKKVLPKDLIEDVGLYGKDSIYFEIIEECEENELGVRESYWINFGENVYNIKNMANEFPETISSKRIEKFWQYVDILDKNSCWNWFGAKCSNGRYGHFYLGNKTHLSHRISYFINNGKFDVSQTICHKCDNKLCVNPSHLEIGSHNKNMQDVLVRKRALKEPIEIVDFIIDTIKKEPQIKAVEIAARILNKFNRSVSQRYINGVKFNKTTTIVHGNLYRNRGHKLNWDIINYIRTEHVNYTSRELIHKVYKKYDIKVSKSNICYILANNIWFDKDYVPRPRSVKNSP